MPRPVLITGCSSGIGLATARLLAERGVPVYATVRTEADAARLAQIDGVESFVCDVTDDAQVVRLREAIDARGAGLWGLVHNAGIGHVAPLTETPLEDLRAVFEVNVFGVHRVTNALHDLIVAAGGRIVAVSSISGTLTPETLGPYSMSKHALEAYTDALAKQLAGVGVHVCAVVPGNFDSAITTNLVRRFAPPASASDDLRALYEPGADTSRARFPGPEAVAEVVHAALFDEEPLERYLVTPDEEEAVRTLEVAAREWLRLNRSTPHRWSRERFAEVLDELEHVEGAQTAAVDAWAPELDALAAAPEHHELLFENERVRVLTTRIPAGETTAVHTHRWPSVLVVDRWAPFVRRDGDGVVVLDSRTVPSTASPAPAIWSAPLPPHSLENVGDDELRVLSVEVKSAG
ncbi:MAG: SDR family NAD(P)-dependent oxidoreductase [Trueperaceae bacterium]